MFRTLAFAAGLAAASPLSAHDFKLGDLTADHPYAFPTLTAVQVAGGFLTLSNAGDSPVTLLGVESDAARRVEIHRSEVVDGMMTMTRQDGIEIAPGETLALEPGGLHVMFMGLDGDPFDLGEEIPATLVFDVGRLDVVFVVEERTAEAGGTMDHGDMDHGAHDNDHD